MLTVTMTKAIKTPKMKEFDVVYGGLKPTKEVREVETVSNATVVNAEPPASDARSYDSIASLEYPKSDYITKTTAKIDGVSIPVQNLILRMSRLMLPAKFPLKSHLHHQRCVWMKTAPKKMWSQLREFLAMAGWNERVVR